MFSVRALDAEIIFDLVLTCIAPSLASFPRPINVIPAKAGIHSKIKAPHRRHSRLRGNDGEKAAMTLEALRINAVNLV